jgi:formylglycine-generating enzyme required for sulfatase activity
METCSVQSMRDRSCGAYVLFLLFLLCLLIPMAIRVEAGTKDNTLPRTPGSSIFRLAQGTTRDIAPAPPGAERRVALVIGNSRYAVGPLNNPANDAKAITGVLQSLGFEVLSHVDLDLVGMRRALADFGERMAEGGVALFYYSGHGLQVGGKNYLIPLRARLTSERYIAAETVEVDAVLKEMDAARNRLNVIILDACRDNPFARGWRSTARGLAQMGGPPGTLIAYATDPGDVAADGEPGTNGVYTAELLRALPESGLKIEDTFKRAARGVIERTRGRQRPWISSSFTGDFAFVTPAERGPGDRVAAGQSPPASPQSLPPSAPAPPPVASLPPTPSPRPPTPALTGDLDLTSDPSGATVKLDGREVGKTPLTLERLPAGEYTLELDKDGIYVTRKQITIAANTLDKLSLKLDRLKGKLTVFSEPREAKVFLDGREVGSAPLSLDADAGPHTLRLTKEGYKIHEESLTLPANKETRTRITLRSTRGTLEVQTRPTGATVEIAGAHHGQTPLTLSAEEGSYTIRLSLARHRAETRRVEIAAERLTRLQVDLVQGPGPGDIERRGKDNAEMVFIPAGTFTMGDTHGDGYVDEKPTHQVTVNDFRLDRTEVTNAQFARFVQVGGYRPQGEWQQYASGKDQHPVVMVTWHDALAYCRWADKRLPTEAEWEYAARGSDSRKYPWGNAFEDSRGRFSGGSAPVGSYPSGSSPFGILDLAGNVWEWTSTLYKPYPYLTTDGREDPSASGFRVRRGGSWGFEPRMLRSVLRLRGDPTNRYNYLGFRCAQGVN